MGLESTMGNFKKYQNTINWMEYAWNLSHPGRDCKVVIKGSDCETVVRCFGDDEVECLADLDKGAYQFIGWA